MGGGMGGAEGSMGRGDMGGGGMGGGGRTTSGGGEKPKTLEPLGDISSPTQRIEGPNESAAGQGGGSCGARAGNGTNKRPKGE
jgi:hypothetical protein